MGFRPRAERDFFSKKWDFLRYSEKLWTSHVEYNGSSWSPETMTAFTRLLKYFLNENWNRPTIFIKMRVSSKCISAHFRWNRGGRPIGPKLAEVVFPRSFPLIHRNFWSNRSSFRVMTRNFFYLGQAKWNKNWPGKKNGHVNLFDFTG